MSHYRRYTWSMFIKSIYPSLDMWEGGHMKYSFFCIMVLLGLMCSQVSASDMSNIELTDGSVVSGEIISFSNSIVTIKTESLGMLNINSARIRSITSKASQPHTDSEHGDNSSQYNGKFNTQVGNLEKQMRNDPALMELIMSLQDNPEFKQAMQDPEIQEAIRTGDTGKLASNPIIDRLLNNPGVLEIFNKVK